MSGQPRTISGEDGLASAILRAGPPFRRFYQSGGRLAEWNVGAMMIRVVNMVEPRGDMDRGRGARRGGGPRKPTGLSESG